MIPKHATPSSCKAGWKTQLTCIFLGYSIFLTTFTLIKTMGIFFIHIQTEFQASATQVSFTIGLPSAVVFMGGPAYSAAFNTLGIKPTYTLAGMLMFIGFGGCFFANSLFHTQIFMGIIAGIGAGLSNVTTLTLMGRAFYSSRPLALGTLAMGGCTAAAVGAPVLQWCIDMFTWRGAFLLLAAYCLHGVAFGCAIAPVYTEIIKKRQRALMVRVLMSEIRTRTPPSPVHDVGQKSITCDRQNGRKIATDNPEETQPRGEENDSKSQTKAFLPPTGTMRRRRSSVFDRFNALRSNFASVFDLNLLKNPWFVSYCLSCGFSISSRILSGLYIVRYAQSLGMEDHEAAKKLTVLETTAFIMTPVIGLITSVKRNPSKDDGYRVISCLRRVASCIRRSYMLGVYQLLMSAVIFLSTFVENGGGFTAYAAMLGFCFGAVTPLPNVVLADLFGTKRLAGAVGYRSLASGIMLLCMPLLIGHFIDVEGSYRVAQYFTGSMAFLSGVLTLISQAAILYEEKRQNNNRVDDAAFRA